MTLAAAVHISAEDLERYQLGMVKAESELAPWNQLYKWNTWRRRMNNLAVFDGVDSSTPPASTLLRGYQPNAERVSPFQPSLGGLRLPVANANVRIEQIPQPSGSLHSNSA